MQKFVSTIHVCMYAFRALEEEQRLHSQLASDIRARVEGSSSEAEQQQVVGRLQASLATERSRLFEIQQQLDAELGRVKQLDALLKVKDANAQQQHDELAQQLDAERSVCRRLKTDLNTLQVHTAVYCRRSMFVYI